MSADEWITVNVAQYPPGWNASYVRLNLPQTVRDWTATDIRDAAIEHMRLPIIGILVQHRFDGSTPCESYCQPAVFSHEEEGIVPACELGEQQIAGRPEYLGLYLPGESPTAEVIECTGATLRRVAVRDLVRLRCDATERRIRTFAQVAAMAGRAMSLVELDELHDLAQLGGLWDEHLAEAFTARRLELARSRGAA